MCAGNESCVWYTQERLTAVKLPKIPASLCMNIELQITFSLLALRVQLYCSGLYYSDCCIQHPARN